MANHFFTNKNTYRHGLLGSRELDFEIGMRMSPILILGGNGNTLISQNPILTLSIEREMAILTSISILDSGCKPNAS